MGEAFASPLFLRIYATFVGAMLVFAVTVGLLVWAAASSWDEDRIASLIEVAEPAGEPLARALLADDDAEVAGLAAALGDVLDASVIVRPRLHGRRLGPPIGAVDQRRGGPPRSVSPTQLNQIRRGQQVVHRRGFDPPTISLGLRQSGFTRFADEDEDGGQGQRERVDRRGPQADRLIAVVSIEPRHNPRRRLIAVGLLLLVALAGGAWPLARSLTSRLAKLERSTRALARGELAHRAELSHPQPRDEVDQLAVSFNEMAERLEALVTGQRSLLANVSHELRTPIARAKVLAEILGKRVEQVSAAERRGEPLDPDHIARLVRGFTEMQEDFGEVEALIQDLLTSGRLELGRDSVLSIEALDLAELCAAAASRFAATVDCPPGLTIHGDRMLLERLLKNLLANARRACPEGALSIHAAHEADEFVIEIEDEGAGIPSAKRSFIFEPFARLDSARARDEGGVGLGLYLCRQIASAHRGRIRAEDRRDGRAGARFVIHIPRRDP